MTTITIMLVSLIMGFIAGSVSAMVTVEVKTETIRKEIDDAIRGLESARTEAKKAQEETIAVNHALQQLILQFKRERGALWESVNGLWNDYDERHAKTQATASAKAQTAKKSTKKAQGDKNADI